MEMAVHRGGGGRQVAVGDCVHQRIMFAKAVVIGRRAVDIVAQPPPNHGAPHRIERVEEGDE